MFTPNGQLFVDNNTGKLKFKINKMKFSGDTLREAINEYKIKVLGNTTVLQQEPLPRTIMKKPIGPRPDRFNLLAPPSLATPVTRTTLAPLPTPTPLPTPVTRTPLPTPTPPTLLAPLASGVPQATSRALRLNLPGQSLAIPLVGALTKKTIIDRPGIQTTSAFPRAKTAAKTAASPESLPTFTEPKISPSLKSTQSLIMPSSIPPPGYIQALPHRTLLRGGSKVKKSSNPKTKKLRR